MPPLYPDSLAAAPREWRWLDVARALLDVSCEAWALALVALALYSFLDREVRGVVKAFLPLSIALAAAAALAWAARSAGGVPRPLDGDRAIAPLLARAFRGGHAAAVAVFVTYGALAYGRRAAPVLAGVALAGVARALAGPHWAAELAMGGVAGGPLGAGAYLAAVRLFPGGHLARLRDARRGAPGPGRVACGPGSP